MPDGKLRYKAGAETVIFRFSLRRRFFRCEEAGVLGPQGCFAAILARQFAQISFRRRDEFLTDRRALPKPKPTGGRSSSDSRFANRAAHPAVSSLETFAPSPTPSLSTSTKSHLTESNQKMISSVHSLPSSIAHRKGLACSRYVLVCLHPSEIVERFSQRKAKKKLELELNISSSHNLSRVQAALFFPSSA